MSHLTHKLPWNLLTTTLYQDTGRWRCSDRQRLAHFARVFSDVLLEFAETAKPTRDPILNLDHWCKFGGNAETGGGGHLPILSSVLCGYIKLNLAVADERFLPKPDDWVMICCNGSYDGGHIEVHAERFQKVCVWGGSFVSLRPFTAEVTSEIRAICSTYFEALYRYLPSRKSRDEIVRKVEGELDWLFP